MMFEGVETNRYLYALADPLNLVDAQGLASTSSSNQQGVDVSTGTAKCSRSWGERNKEGVWIFIKHLLMKLGWDMGKGLTNPLPGIAGEPIDRLQESAREKINEKSGGKLDLIDPNKAREQIDQLSDRNRLERLMDIECSTCSASGY